MGETELRELFSKYGQVKSIKLKKPQILTPQIQATGTTMAHGFAYVDFAKEEDAQNAKENLNGYKVGM
jgi:RNA recognition motif-containing protein